MGNASSNSNKPQNGVSSSARSSSHVTKSQLRLLKEKRQQVRQTDKNEDDKQPVAPQRNNRLSRRMSTVSAVSSSPATLSTNSVCAPSSVPPPRDLATLLVQIESPEDAADDSRHLGQFRKHLEGQQREAVLDFAIACNILRLKEAEVKALMLKDPTNKRIMAVADEMLELLMAVGQVFIVEGCIEPLELENTVLQANLRELLDSLVRSPNPSNCSDKITEAFGLVWRARCDPRVWRVLQAEYSTWLTAKQSVLSNKIKTSVGRGV